jgi:hypothetical protein
VRTEHRDNRQLGLGPWTQAVSEAVQCMGGNQRAIKELQDKFKRHMDELTELDEEQGRIMLSIRNFPSWEVSFMPRVLLQWMAPRGVL